MLYGFDAPLNLRTAIRKFSKQSRRIRDSSFKECQDFLDVDLKTRTLKIVYSESSKFLFIIGNIMQVIVFIPTFISLTLMVYVHLGFIFPLLIFIFLLFSLMPMVRPYCLAKKLDKELSELYQQT